MQSTSETTGVASIKATQEQSATDFPVREYIGAMSRELAQMARWDGDEPLARLLESASALAEEPLVRSPVVRPSDPKAA
ncbi:hypothetical protein [Brevundimonas sp.]